MKGAARGPHQHLPNIATVGRDALAQLFGKAWREIVKRRVSVAGHGRLHVLPLFGAGVSGIGSMGGAPQGIDAQRPLVRLGRVDGFAERNVGWTPSGLLGFDVRCRITLAHFSVSSAMSLPKSPGDPGSTHAPSSASRALMLGLGEACVDLLVELVDDVGRRVLGRADADSTRSPRSPPRNRRRRHVRQRLRARRRGHRQRAQLAGPDVFDRMAGEVSKAICTCPPSRSVSMGRRPRYGTWIMFT